jgi:hypothetical protein
MSKYRIDQDELWEFLARQARLVEQLPAGEEQAAVEGYSDGLDDSEREAVWLAAGIATFMRHLSRTSPLPEGRGASRGYFNERSSGIG